MIQGFEAIQRGTDGNWASCGPIAIDMKKVSAISWALTGTAASGFSPDESKTVIVGFGFDVIVSTPYEDVLRLWRAVSS